MQNSVSEVALSKVWGCLNKAIIVRGQGSYLFDEQDNRYLDFTSGIGVNSTGHCHPKVVAAVQAQASQLLFGQLNCVRPKITEQYAQALQAITPKSIETFFFSNSGAEAVEGAVKLAKVATGRTNMIAFDGGFHGRTAMTMALTASKNIYRAGYQPLPSGVFTSPFPNAFRYGWESDQAVTFCLDQLDRLLKTQTSPAETAAMIIEPVLGEGGFLPAPVDFLIGLRKVCDETGILLILDEIQSGFGRTGKMWAHESSGIVPDIMTMAKGIASGLPMSAFGGSYELMSKLPTGSHGGTYGGGSAVAMAAAMATLEVIEEEKLVQNAAKMGDYLQQQLSSLLSGLPTTVDIRSAGLMVGVEFDRDGKPDSEMARSLQNGCLERGLMLLICGTDGNVIRWSPPLNVSVEEIDSALEIFETAVQSAGSTTG